MALEDFDSLESPRAPAPKPPRPVAPPVRPTPPAPAQHALTDDDEDLFNFPLVQPTFEAETAPAPKPPPVAAPTPTPAPAPSPVPAQAAEAVARAAQLVEDLEQVLAEDPLPRERAPEPAPALRGPAPLVLAGLGALLLTNALGLVFLWRSSSSLEDGVQAMNERIVQTLRQQPVQQAHVEPAPQPAQPAPVLQAPAPLEAFEKTTLQMAHEEIQAGEYAAARRRLSRLLATADRIESEARENIEAEASFLLASTYRKQAEAAREKSP